MEYLINARKKTDEALADLRAARSSLRMEKEKRDEAITALADAEEALKVAQIVAQGVQQQAHDRIAGIVTRCLAAVFPNPYEFRIAFEQKRGQTEARLEFVRGEVRLDPMTASGGGMVDVAAFALRLSCLLLSRPPVRRIMILDEPFKFVSKEHREKLRSLILALSQELGVQFIIVTHLRELEIGNVIDLSDDHA